MISSQRQQKKNARYKKKIPAAGKGQFDNEKQERITKDSSSTLTAPKIEDTPTPINAVTTKTEINDVQDIATENKYSKRKVVSNIDRYREIDDNEYQVETDEQLQARLVQLLNIPKAHSSMLPMIEDEPDSTHEQYLPSSLALDCIALVRALESIPIHKKLDIDVSLVDLCDQTYDSNASTAEASQSASKTGQKNHPFLSELVLKKGKPQFQFQLPASTATSLGHNQKPKEEKTSQQTTSVNKPKEEKINAQKPIPAPSTVSCGTAPPFLVIPNSEAPLKHSSQASELDNALDAILAL